MKTFPNLAGGLRFYFGVARALVVVFAAFWLVTLTFGPSLRRFFGPGPGLMVSVSEASLKTQPGAVTLNSDQARAGSLVLSSLRGSLQVDLLTDDDALRAALRWAVFPCIAVLVGFTWQLFGLLRDFCANIDRKEAFSEKNLRLVRNIGLLLIGYSLAAFAAQLFAAHMLGAYLEHHVTLAAPKTGLPLLPGAGSVSPSFPGGMFPGELGIVTGFMVLLLAEAFRQGLSLKTENDLTV